VSFAVVLGGILLFVARRVREGRLGREEWIPVALVGTILLNPRVKEYDVAALTIPMLLIAWRMLRFGVNLSLGRRQGAAGQVGGRWQNLPDPALCLAASGWFLAFNMIGSQVEWKPTELGLLLGVFALGVGSLYCPLGAPSMILPPAATNLYEEKDVSYAISR
jgi:hypothetical protein